MSEDAARPFDLIQGPLLRATLLRCGAQEHFLLLSMHHIVSDAWSIEIAIRELFASYEAHSTGATAALAALTLQYADYAYWQRQWLRSALPAQQLEYWKVQLADQTPTELPTDYPRPLVQTFRVGAQTLSIPSPLAAAL
jgi:hypothetical protein